MTKTDSQNRDNCTLLNVHFVLDEGVHLEKTWAKSNIYQLGSVCVGAGVGVGLQLWEERTNIYWISMSSVLSYLYYFTYTTHPHLFIGEEMEAQKGSVFYVSLTDSRDSMRFALHPVLYRF